MGVAQLGFQRPCRVAETRAPTIFDERLAFVGPVPVDVGFALANLGEEPAAIGTVQAFPTRNHFRPLLVREFGIGIDTGRCGWRIGLRGGGDVQRTARGERDHQPARGLRDGAVHVRVPTSHFSAAS